MAGCWVAAEHKGWCGQVEKICRARPLVLGPVIAIGVAVALVTFGAPGRVHADPGVTVFPGMEIRQGSAVCVVGFVEPRARIALTTGKCDGGAIATDSHANVVGTVMLARRNTANESAPDGAIPGINYEVIKLAAGVTPSQMLPAGRQLQSAPGLRALPGLPVCHFGLSTGQTCGRVDSIGNGRFVISDMAADKFGGPVYALTDDNHAVIVGLLDGTSGALPEAESWQDVMKQLYLDIRPPSSQQLPAEVRTISWIPSKGGGACANELSSPVLVATSAQLC